MIIKSLEIISFGKFKDKTIDFNHGLNVICGNNESGKSTVMSFIYAMLYGFGDNRGKSASLREKYTPWDGGVCEGKLLLQTDDGENITLYRKAGAVKKHDTLRVYNTDTGEELSLLPEDIAGVGSDTFSKTLYIKQMSTVFGGTNDEIVQKLSNISEGGDESISFEKAIKILENARREIRPLRGSSGSLAQINSEIAELEKRRSVRAAMESELSDAQSLLPRAEIHAKEAKEKYETAMKEDFISPAAHLRGRIEEKEAYINKTTPSKKAFSFKKGYTSCGIILLALAALSLTFNYIIAALLFAVGAVCIGLSFTAKKPVLETVEVDSLEKLREELAALEKKKALHEDNLAALRKNVSDSRERLSTLTVRIKSLQMQIAENKDGDLDSLYEKKRTLERKLAAFTLAIDALNTSHEKMQRDFTPALNKKASEYFSAITSGKYTRLFSDEQFNLTIDMEIPRKSELFSGGTVDQLYLSLRLALIDMLFNDDMAFILLDQPFLQYDNTRRKKTVELLESLSDKRQILLFTSDESAFSANKQIEMLT